MHENIRIQRHDSVTLKITCFFVPSVPFMLNVYVHRLIRLAQKTKKTWKTKMILRYNSILCSHAKDTCMIGQVHNRAETNTNFTIRIV